MLVSNVPAAIQGAELLGSLVFKNAGIDYKVTPVNSGTAVVTPQLRAARSSRSDGSAGGGYLGGGATRPPR
jgi:hypothetical protein